MNRTFCLAKRNFLEMIREPLSLVFCLFLPLVMLILMESVFGSANVEMFDINSFAPGIAVFGFTFTMLFLSLGISADKNSSFMVRLLVSPTKPYEYFLSFVISSLPICVVQTIIFYAVSVIFGLKITGGLVLSLITLIPTYLFYISCGLFIGALVKNDKQAGPISSIIISGTGILGGIWFPLEQVGSGFLSVCKILPFYNSIVLAKAPISGNYSGFILSLIITLAYFIVLFTLSFLIFNKNVKK